MKNIFIVLLTASLQICSFSCSTSNDFNDPEEVLDSLESGQYRILAVRSCGSGALGGCKSYIHKYSKKGILDRAFGNRIISCSSEYSHIELQFLSEDLLLVRISAGGKVFNPDLVLPIDLSHDLIHFGPEKPGPEWKSFDKIVHSNYSIEVFNSEKYLNDFALHMWLNVDQNIERNFYVFGADSLSATFLNDTLLKIDFDLIKEDTLSTIYLSLWQSLYENVKIYYDSVPIF